MEDEGQGEEEDWQGELEELAIDVNLLLHLAKVQRSFPCYLLKYCCKEKVVALLMCSGFLISSGVSFKCLLCTELIKTCNERTKIKQN